MKVYCKNCKWYDSDFGKYWACFYGYEKDNQLNAIGYYEKSRLGKDCIERNKIYNCKYYKRKWYKFWIKDKRCLIEKKGE